MRVEIAGLEYELKLAQGKLVVNGEVSACVVDHDKAEIAVSDLVPMPLRMDVAAQAVSEAWKHKMGSRAVKVQGTVS